MDYAERDDQLVGIAAAYRRNNPDADARLLTHDTGPMATAGMVGVPVLPVPDSWLLAPERTEKETHIAALQAEIARLKKDAPAFRVACHDAEDQEVDEIETEIFRYSALTTAELALLMKRIKTGLPMATDFGSEPNPLESARRMVAGQIFDPPKKQEISDYQTAAYPEWLQTCEETLRSCHLVLQGRTPQARFRFAITNEGTKPGKDVLVVVEAMGKFVIMPPPRRSQQTKRDAIFELSEPPTPPSGTWRDAFSSYAMADVFRQASIYAEPRLMDSVLAGLSDAQLRRDPNALYWKPKRPEKPGETFAQE